ncbi:MAG: sulfatase-like hydrolase/transferase [Hyphomicrobiales bacterium]|nr:sulfatase-like hydrolase/transferase [Hyphomicrobiales bacterium]
MAITDLSFLRRPLTGFERIPQPARIAVVALLHAAGLAVILATEYGPLGLTLALLSWVLLNCFWLALLRRPAPAAALSLAMFAAIVILSRFKFEILEMTLSFFDMLVVDSDTVAFLLAIFPDLRMGLLLAAAAAVPILLVLWRLDSLRLGRRTSAAGAAACLGGIVVLSSVVPEEPWEPFSGVNHVSNFARSGVLSVSELISHGWLESDATTAERLKLVPGAPCQPAAQPPHIILLLDESSFDITTAPGIKVPDGYREHFRSSDGKARSLLVEATGGPTWYAEYNVLTGLSARSYGRFMFNVTRIAAGHVKRGLPQALRHCGYKTFSLYPAYGAFLSARRFQTTTGVERFTDLKEMGAASDMQPDRFYLDQAARVIARERGDAPLFLFTYVVANHFPWTSPFRPDLTPGWKAPGNAPEVDEYIRRQRMSAQDYADFRARLAREFPQDSFLIVRFGDHQPAISTKVLEPGADPSTVARRVMLQDPRYFTTYYAVDAVNFVPLDLSSALERIEAANLPLVVLEAAGLPLDPTFAEQKRILTRCRGLFYRCNDGAEARRFNRQLIDAGLITGL